MTDQHEPDTKREVEMVQFAGLLRELEGRHDRHGWRKSLITLYVIFDRHRHRKTTDILTHVMRTIGPAIVVGCYGAQPLVVDKLLEDADMAPWEALSKFAHNVAFADADQLHNSGDEGDTELAGGLRMIRDLLRIPSIVGFAACYEGHGLEEISPALVEAVSGPEDIHALPGAREGRMLVAVDAGDQVHTVQRIRGHDQVVHLFTSLHGSVTNSLRSLMDVTMDRLPATQEEADARYQPFDARVGGAAFQGRQHQPGG